MRLMTIVYTCIVNFVNCFTGYKQRALVVNVYANDSALFQTLKTKHDNLLDIDFCGLIQIKGL